jgi:hypothetical protein
MWRRWPNASENPALTSNLIATQFDQISEVYDETRKPLKDAAVDKIVSILKGRL